jgi:hypothetical protein
MGYVRPFDVRASKGPVAHHQRCSSGCRRNAGSAEAAKTFSLLALSARARARARSRGLKALPRSPASPLPLMSHQHSNAGSPGKRAPAEGLSARRPGHENQRRCRPNKGSCKCYQYADSKIQPACHPVRISGGLSLLSKWEERVAPIVLLLSRRRYTVHSTSRLSASAASVVPHYEFSIMPTSAAAQPKV